MKLFGVTIFGENRISSIKPPPAKKALPLSHNFKQKALSSPNKRPDASTV